MATIENQATLREPLAATYLGTFPQRNPLDRFRATAADQISKITGVDGDLVFAGVDRTNSLDKGDLVFAVPRLRVKGVAPVELAKRIVSEFQPCEGAQVSPPVADEATLRFGLSPSELLSTLLPMILQQRGTYGHNMGRGRRNPLDPNSESKTVIVEFSSPNIAKKFHAGHLRSTIIGGFLSNLYESSGYKVVRMNYLGDWGRQYGILACGIERYGKEMAVGDDPIGNLFNIYVKISADLEPEEEAFKAARDRGEDTAQRESTGLLGAAKAYFKKMEDGDKDALDLWKLYHGLSIQKYKETYTRLNIHFDDYSGESTVEKDTMAHALDIFKAQGVATSDGGA